MKEIKALFLLILFFVTGCSLNHTVSPSHPFSCQKYQEALQLKRLPPELQKAFNAQSLNCKMSNNKKDDDLNTTLHALLTFSPMIKPDEKFQRLEAVSRGSVSKGKQHYVEALSHYLIDNHYHCTHPIFADYFSKKYVQALNFSLCPKTVPFYIYDMDTGGKVVNVNPKNVEAIHIIFTSNGEKLESSFGHVALRLVICPDHNNSKIACSENIYKHIVLGYMANINELEINMMKGVFGGYNSRLFGSSFMETYRENTIDAFRNIFSLPLILQNNEKELLVRKLSEIHWTYHGNYQFFANNCATLLQESLDELFAKYRETDLHDNIFMRPDSFFKKIKNSKLVNRKKLQNLQRAEEQGYYFPSNLIYYKKALRLISNSMRHHIYKDIGAYLLTNPKKRLLSILSDKH